MKSDNRPHSLRDIKRRGDRVHIIDTEVRDFDDAIDIIAATQRAAKIKLSLANKPPSLRAQFARANNGARLRGIRGEISLAGPPVETGNKQWKKWSDARKVRVRNRDDANDRMAERIKKAIDILAFGIEELSEHGLDGQSVIVNVIDMLCHQIKIQPPTFTASRRPGMKPSQHPCVDCGEMMDVVDGELCVNCKPVSPVRAASEERRNRERETESLKREVKSLGKIINRTERAVKNGDN